MRKLIILFVLLNGTNITAQSVYNTNAGSARFICESQGSFSQTFQNQYTCVEREVHLFYYYRPNTNYASSNLFTITANSAGIECGVNVWEFNSLQEAEADYLSTSPIVASSLAYTQIVNHALTLGKIYLMELIVRDCDATVDIVNENPEVFNDDWEDDPCAGCLGGFMPSGGTYVLSAWVKDNDAALGSITYNKPYVSVTSGTTVTNCYTSGQIIDGWQRIEKEVEIEEGEALNIDLVCTTDGDCLFDDIRFFPKDASMITYVYDPITLRLVAELDERNYAKMYEYDEQGKLIRVKKETEIGIMTIQENRENNSKE